MAQPIPRHPAVALRSNHAQLRALLAIAAVVLAIAAVAVVALVTDDDSAATSRSVSPVPERVTDSISAQSAERRASIGGKTAPVGARFDGGPEEGTRGVGH